MKFSKTTMGFYDDAHPSIPMDAEDIPDDLYRSLMGKSITIDAFGLPVELVPTAPSADELLGIAKDELRAIRAPMLDALTGIAGRAMRAGNSALVAEADTLADNLLAITDDAALNAATTYEAMQAAGVAAYRRIAGTASPELGVVFREITGA